LLQPIADLRAHARKQVSMAANDPERRREISRRGAHAKWARTVDRTEATRVARETFLAQFEAPAEVTDPRQRESMREHALSLAMARIRDARQTAPAGGV
jgi:hypothetical protein